MEEIRENPFKMGENMNFIQKRAFGGLTKTFYKAYQQGFIHEKTQKKALTEKQFNENIVNAKKRGLTKKIKSKVFDTVGDGLYKTYFFGRQCAKEKKQLMQKKEFEKNFLTGFRKGISGGIKNSFKPKTGGG